MKFGILFFSTAMYDILLLLNFIFKTRLQGSGVVTLREQMDMDLTFTSTTRKCRIKIVRLTSIFDKTDVNINAVA